MSRTVKQWLLNAKSSPVSAAEARILLSHCLDKPREWLIAHDEDPIPESIDIQASAMLERRIFGEPVAHLTGHKEFYGRVFRVSPEVLIPRPETELLVDTALELMGDRQTCRVLDLGAGTGCIGITLALEKPNWEVVGTDVSNNSLNVAKHNAVALEATNIQFLIGSWWDAIEPHRQFDLIVSNPPYIKNNDPHLTQGDLRFEPQLALTDKSDGLSAYRNIVMGLVKHSSYLETQGVVIMEHGYDQSEPLAGIFSQTNRFETRSINDLAGHPRLIIARRQTAR